MYAVIRAGGKQYRVSPGDVVRVEGSTAPTATSNFRRARRFIGAGRRGASRSRSPRDRRDRGSGTRQKILVFHYKRKKQYKKLRGHRQAFTAVRITEIAFDGQSSRPPISPKKNRKVKKPLLKSTEAKASAKPAKKKAAKNRSEEDNRRRISGS